MKRSSKNARTCPDCRVELQPIKLLDATEQVRMQGATHVDVTYAAPDAKRSFFTQTIPPAGTVRGLVCPECGLIQMYAVPKSAQS